MSLRHLENPQVGRISPSAAVCVAVYNYPYGRGIWMGLQIQKFHIQRNSLHCFNIAKHPVSRTTYIHTVRNSYGFLNLKPHPDLL